MSPSEVYNTYLNNDKSESQYSTISSLDNLIRSKMSAEALLKGYKISFARDYYHGLLDIARARGVDDEIQHEIIIDDEIHYEIIIETIEYKYEEFKAFMEDFIKNEPPDASHQEYAFMKKQSLSIKEMAALRKLYSKECGYNDLMFDIKRIASEKFPSEVEEEIIEYSDTKTNERILALSMLGLLDAIREKGELGLSNSKLAQAVCYLTGANYTTVQPIINSIFSPTDSQTDKNPHYKEKLVKKVRERLASLDLSAD